jgi:hypothetical protein
MTIAAVDELDRLRHLYDSGFHDAFLDKALRKIIDHQIARDQADLQRVDEALAEFEARYGLSTTEFWEQYRAGQMADTADHTEWNALCKMRQRILARLSILRGEADSG